MEHGQLSRELEGVLLKRILFACFVALLCGRGALGDFSYQTLDYPGAANTFASAIEGKVVVGEYTLTSTPFPYHGFVYDGSSYTTLDYPGASSTVLQDIDAGRIVGSYVTGGINHGFKYENGVFTTIDNPLTNPNSANGDEVSGISGNKLVGVFIDNNNSTHGYVYDGTNFTTLVSPYSSFSTATGIDGNTIVGSYGSGGYKFNGSSYSQVNDPVGTDTTPLDISGNRIVGYYAAAGPAYHGFYFDGSTFVTLNEPASLGHEFLANGISGTTIVGQYIGARGYRGFIAVQVPEPALAGLVLPALLLFTTRKSRVRISKFRVSNLC
jgi:hypothetical protein